MLWNRSFSNSPNVSNNPLELILNLQARKSNSINQYVYLPISFQLALYISFMKKNNNIKQNGKTYNIPQKENTLIKENKNTKMLSGQKCKGMDPFKINPCFPVLRK